MDFISIFLLAVVQGITEFLPISSSAHLILTGAVLGTSGQTLATDIAMHFGTILAVLAFYAKPITGMVKNVVGGKEKGDFANPKIIWLLIISLIPTGIGGFLLHSFVESYARSIFWIAINSIVFGGLLYYADRFKENKVISSMNWKQAIIIGVTQILAVFPGVSRAGITLTTLRFLGFNREASIYYSVLLSVPTILGAAVLAFGSSVVIELSTVFWSILLSFIFTLLCLVLFVRWIKQAHNFDVFVYYRIVLGIVLLFLL
ncbi:MAG: undecaprenyl-diphosphate phosphatase [Alphaproteobacteria bacterium]|nr:undecaprenyl-diphosphate phosphatase [Alphaproteobacteria bacterium]MBN2780263.1 undecaprenyl-diphosphate phosphatase [Alphaproteobacteria bacterium]